MKASNHRKYGFGIIGTGAIASFHAKAIEAITDARLIAVQSQTYRQAKEFAEQNDCEAYETIEELLLREDINIVSICTPSGVHAEPALKSIAAGKHCLIEKPIEVTLERSDEIIEAAKLKGVLLAVVFPSRFYEGSQTLKKALDTGQFGKVALASAYVKWSRTADYYNSAKWRGTWQLDGGGALMNQAIHAVDMLQWCMGPVESVMAFKNNIKHTEIEVEDTLVAALKFANGAVGSIECSTAVYPGTLKKLEIMGTRGTAIMEDNNLVKWEFDSECEQVQNINLSNPRALTGGASNPLSISQLGHQKQIENLIQAIAGREKLLVDGQEARKSVEIVLAIYRSAENGNVVHLPLKTQPQSHKSEL